MPKENANTGIPTTPQDGETLKFSFKHGYMKGGKPLQRMDKSKVIAQIEKATKTDIKDPLDILMACTESLPVRNNDTSSSDDVVVLDNQSKELTDKLAEHYTHLGGLTAKMSEELRDTVLLVNKLVERVRKAESRVKDMQETRDSEAKIIAETFTFLQQEIWALNRFAGNLFKKVENPPRPLVMQIPPSVMSGITFIRGDNNNPSSKPQAVIQKSEKKDSESNKQ